jgi:hypothetical protein
MKILISESQYQTLLKELDSRPDNHDIDQQNNRLDLLRNGIDLVLEYVKHELDNKIGWLPRGLQTKIVGKYVLTDTIAEIIKERLENIYKYDFPLDKDFAILVYDFELNSPTVRTEQIKYPEGKEGEKMRELVTRAFSMKRNDAKLYFTNYEPVDKNKPEGEKSKTDRSNCLVLVLRGNVAQTLFLTQKSQWEENQARVDHNINHTEIEKYVSTPSDNSDEKTDSKPNVNFSPLELMRQNLKETWILDWIEGKYKN